MGVNASAGAMLDPSLHSALTYSVTFGHYTQGVGWSDVRALSWSELTDVLTRHEVGPKEGTCIVPATFTGTRRHKADARQINVVFLDSDAGATLAEITDALRQRGWAAVVSSTHSHLTTRTRAKRSNWDKFGSTQPSASDAPAAFLVQEKDYLPRIAADARLVEETDEYVLLEHQPCPKFRVALPLLRPWLAAGYTDQNAANAGWKERIEALAASLRLSHDQACTDTSRLFFLPRRPANGPPAETAVLDGALCDIFALPGANKQGGAEAGSTRRKGQQRRSGRDERLKFNDPATSEVFDLTSWARRLAGKFEIATALKARRPEVFVTRPGEAPKRHVHCVNEGEHTQAGGDAATFVVNASQSESGGFVHHCRHGYCDGRDRLFFVCRMLEEGWLTVADLTDPRFLSGEVRPLIRFVAGKLPEVVDQAEDALIRADAGLYQRGTFLVRPGVVRVAVPLRGDVVVPRILEVGDRALVEEMTRAADWEKYDARSDDWVRIDAPLAVAATYLQRTGHWRLPVLTALINAPTLRPDGSILSDPGYDRATGLLLDNCGVRFPAIPDQPDWEQGREALSVLLGLIETFPFVGEADRAVALSAILTACVRRSLDTAPLHAFTAPVMGSGKSKLVDVATLIAGGREASVIAQGKTEEELEKRLGALLLAGEPVIAIDNCEAPLGGEFLCAMLTQRRVRARILGRSEAPELPANALVTATGNNLVLVGDMTRRAVLCRLDPQHERPELRRFSSNPIATVKADRGRFLVAALTVLRAYHVAGRPDRPDSLGSFEEWSGWVRGALIWVGQADPVETMEETRDLDPKLDALVAVLTQWQAVIGTASVAVRDVIERATQQRTPEGQDTLRYPKQEFIHPDFREALLAVANDGGVVNSRRLGKWLAANAGRIVEGLRITRQGLNGGILRWQLEIALVGPASDAQ